MQWIRTAMVRYMVLSLIVMSVAACSKSTAESSAPSTFSIKTVTKFVFALLAPIRAEQPNTIASLEKYGEHFDQQGKYDLAEKHYQKALTIRQAGWGEAHANVVPGLEKLASFYTSHGKYAEAEPLFHRALALREKLVGVNHPDIALTLEPYAVFLRKMQRDAEAIAVERRVQVLRAP